MEYNDKVYIAVEVRRDNKRWGDEWRYGVVAD